MSESIHASTTLRLRHALQRLWVNLKIKRRRQILLVAMLMILSSIAEMFSLGAVVPFLAVLAEPDKVWVTREVQSLAPFLGWQQPTDLVLPLCFVFAAAAAFNGIVRLLALRGTIALANGIGSDLSIEVYRRTLYQPYAVHLQRNSSEAISAIASRVDQVVGMVSGILQMLTAGLVSLGLACLLLFLSPFVTLSMALVLGGGYLLAMAYSRRRLQRLGPEIMKNQTQLIRSLQEGLGAIRDVILAGNQPVYTTIYGQADRRLRQQRGLAQFLAFAPRYGMEAVGLIAIAMTALRLVAGPTSVLGALPLLGALALGAQRLLPSLQLIYLSWNNCRVNIPALSSILCYLEQPIDQADLLAVPAAPLRLEREILLKGVGFRYAKEASWVFRELDLRIGRGERIGIVGKTGSGKSTLIDLLMGLLEPTSGRVLVDGLALEGERLRAWRSTVAHVPQSIFLADASIAENIAFGVKKGQLDLQRLEQAIEQAQIANFISSLPNGYHTEVGERGVRLSGGQRQRIGIARALYKQAAVLVMDEATSALDEATEAQVMNAINKMSPDLTILMIAHRLSTLEKCDSIFNVGNAEHL
ncbi:ABC transporter ATP-binding protein [Synechococcus sp. WH 8016]|uniref:ABC transporter ATP-binding protein n=1 Tax=Synechococcus sp. WH 8016 TaxID=166318 RepID=UPI00022D9E95|nr:ABC transporter ATP-binding protein [Synechococcus sp. WH 8016]EHA62389.1 Xenobiotic-transporting ATPase [Synechococcus sp. WH 8016]